MGCASTASTAWGASRSLTTARPTGCESSSAERALRSPGLIAAINTHMCQLAGEACDGIRPHPITTRKFITEGMLPNVEIGARRTGRRLEGVAVGLSPPGAGGEDDAELAGRLRDVRARIAFYASPRTYRPVFEAHGWGGLVDRLHQPSVPERGAEMPELGRGGGR